MPGKRQCPPQDDQPEQEPSPQQPDPAAVGIIIDSWYRTAYENANQCVDHLMEQADNQRVIIRHQERVQRALERAHNLYERMLHEIFQENIRIRNLYQHLLVFDDLPPDDVPNLEELMTEEEVVAGSETDSDMTVDIDTERARDREDDLEGLNDF